MFQIYFRLKITEWHYHVTFGDKNIERNAHILLQKETMEREA